LDRHILDFRSWRWIFRASQRVSLCAVPAVDDIAPAAVVAAVAPAEVVVAVEIVVAGALSVVSQLISVKSLDRGI
jgi:hypothetical protein